MVKMASLTAVTFFAVGHLTSSSYALLTNQVKTNQIVTSAFVFPQTVNSMADDILAKTTSISEIQTAGLKQINYCQKGGSSVDAQKVAGDLSNKVNQVKQSEQEISQTMNQFNQYMQKAQENVKNAKNSLAEIENNLNKNITHQQTKGKKLSSDQRELILKLGFDQETLNKLESLPEDLQAEFVNQLIMAKKNLLSSEKVLQYITTAYNRAITSQSSTANSVNALEQLAGQAAKIAKDRKTEEERTSQEANNKQQSSSITNQQNTQTNNNGNQGVNNNDTTANQPNQQQETTVTNQPATQTNSTNTNQQDTSPTQVNK